jgi:hypothetical protein
MSPVYTGIGLLLHTPQLALSANQPKRWEKLDIPGVKLLVGLLELLRSEPHYHSGVALERWRGTPEGDQLAEMAKWNISLPADGVEAEFLGVMKWLDTELARLRRDELDAKWQREGLTPAEKTEFVELQRRCTGKTPVTPH